MRGTEVVPEKVTTDLKARPLRVRIEDATFIVDAWGGEHAEVPLASIAEVLTYDVERINPKGPNPRWSGILLRDEGGRVILRVTGRWSVHEVQGLFADHRFLRCRALFGIDSGELREIRRMNRGKNRAPGWRKLRMRSRWLVAWRAAVILGGFTATVLLVVYGQVLFGEDGGIVPGLLLGVLLWFLAGVSLPKWIRAGYQRRRCH
ncbi:hypothetical protein [Sciscionella sediminilitoris]|uniref:hypothetical protein n=1 Tax=Sciscionella sediminilitoris TaxID=1445613 RepID=UPI0004DFC8CF|nr:hypothetical protein [Sciscionella sp. SE31]